MIDRLGVLVADEVHRRSPHGRDAHFRTALEHHTAMLCGDIRSAAIGRGHIWAIKPARYSRSALHTRCRQVSRRHVVNHSNPLARHRRSTQYAAGIRGLSPTFAPLMGQTLTFDLLSQHDGAMLMASSGRSQQEMAH